MSWRWDTARDAAEFRRAIDGALEEGLGAEPAGGRSGEWTLRGGAVRVEARGARRVMLVLAPDGVTAARLAGS